MSILLLTGEDDAPEWDARFGDFLAELFFGDGLAESTLRKLGAMLRTFNAWLLDATGRPWDRVSEAEVRAYLDSLRSSNAVSTLRLKQWMVKRLYSWARQAGIAALRTSRAILELRGGRALRRAPPTRNQMVKLLKQPNTSTPRGVRDRAVLEVLYGTGLRATELLGLTLDQVQHGKCMTVLGKGAKERLVVLGEHALHWISQYKVLRHSLLAAGGHESRSTQKLFVSTGRYPDFQYLELWRMVRRYGDKCGLHVSPHQLRHAFATHLYQGKAPLESIRLLLGHEQLATTAMYVFRYQEDNQLLWHRHHPRGSGYIAYRRWCHRSNA